jgi:hypothetical protein
MTQQPPTEYPTPTPTSTDPAQLALLPEAPFDGPDSHSERGHRRLRGQQLRVYQTLLVGEWLTLSEIRDRTRDPEASISAQIRHLRKPRFGSHQVDKRRRGENGLWEYRLVL